MTDGYRNKDKFRQKLTPHQYRVLRQKGTELPFTGKYWKHKERGVYKCATCGTKLFSSDTKIDTPRGWPSFFDDLGREGIRDDRSFLIERTQLICRRCRGHLGHIFLDGPKPTGKRFCINSLDFTAK